MSRPFESPRPATIRSKLMQGIGLIKGPMKQKAGFHKVELEEKTSNELGECVKAAEKAPAPSLESMFDEVYAELPWNLREQKAELLAGPRAKGHGGH